MCKTGAKEGMAVEDRSIIRKKPSPLTGTKKIPQEHLRNRQDPTHHRLKDAKKYKLFIPEAGVPAWEGGIGSLGFISPFLVIQTFRGCCCHGPGGLVTAYTGGRTWCCPSQAGHIFPPCFCIAAS